MPTRYRVPIVVRKSDPLLYLWVSAKEGETAIFNCSDKILVSVAIILEIASPKVSVTSSEISVASAPSILFAIWRTLLSGAAIIQEPVIPPVILLALPTMTDVKSSASLTLVPVKKLTWSNVIVELVNWPRTSALALPKSLNNLF